MNSMADLIEHVKTQGHLIHDHPKVVFDNLTEKFHHFVANLKQEGRDDKAAFQLLVDATFHGRHLTHEEKIQIENQLKDSLKTVGLISLTILPGGSLFFILSSFLKLNKYIIPSVFLKG
jgi:hypothetical protein